MPVLSYVNVFAQDIEQLAGFYRHLFNFTEISEIRSPIFIGLRTGQSCLGFNAHDAYDLLKLSDYANPTGAKFLLNIEVDSREDVERLVPQAIALGARVIKEPYLTYYNWYQAVLLDPEDNVFRINRML